MTINLRYNNSYISYNNFIKQYLNLTAFMYTENMMKQPIIHKFENYKKIRQCLPKDYARVNVQGYID